jgi:1-acyl-sn-glycerol-3-phosphate acyltransferase
MNKSSASVDEPSQMQEPFWPADAATVLNSICGYTTFAFFCLTLPLFLPLAFILPGGRRRWIAVAMRYAMRTVFFCTPTVSWRFDGDLAALRTTRVVVSNHEGMLDILAACALPGWRTMLAKTWVFNAFPLGVAARAAGLCNSDLLTPDAYQADAAMTLPDSQIGLFVFPEGSRSRSGIMQRFRPGAFVLAKHLPSSVVPVAMVGSRQGIRPGSMWIHPTRVRLRVLPAMSIRSDESYRQFAERVRVAIITERCKVMKQMLASGELDRHLKSRFSVLARHLREKALSELRERQWMKILDQTAAHGPWLFFGLGWSVMPLVVRMLYPQAVIYACESEDDRRVAATCLWQRADDVVVRDVNELPALAADVTVICHWTGEAGEVASAWLLRYAATQPAQAPGES